MLKYVQGGSQGQDEPSSSSAIPGHQPPAIVDPATIPSQEEQEPSTTSSGTVPYTSTTESPVTERLSESDTGDTGIKTYLRSSMGQERLSGLAVISINGDVAQKLSYDDLIADFATRKCRRVPL